MTEEARPVVKNNKLLQYPSGESTDRARASEGGRKRERETEKPRENERSACTGNFSLGSFSSLFRARWMPVREGVINNDLMSSNNGHHGWFPRSPRSLWRPPRDHSAQFLSLLLSFYARRYLPVSLLPFSSSSSVSALLSPLFTTANIHPRSRC